MQSGGSIHIGRVGEITSSVIDILKLSIEVGTPVFIGQSNIDHMLSRHPNDFFKYGCCIEGIIKEPDYVGQNRVDESIEYVKDFSIDGEYVKVAVRVSTSGKYFVRSIYILNPKRVKSFISKGTLKPLT